MKRIVIIYVLLITVFVSYGVKPEDTRFCFVEKDGLLPLDDLNPHYDALSQTDLTLRLVYDQQAGESVTTKYVAKAIFSVYTVQQSHDLHAILKKHIFSLKVYGPLLKDMTQLIVFFTLEVESDFRNHQGFGKKMLSSSLEYLREHYDGYPMIWAASPYSFIKKEAAQQDPSLKENAAGRYRKMSMDELCKLYTKHTNNEAKEVFRGPDENGVEYAGFYMLIKKQ